MTQPGRRPRLLLASANQGKLRELRTILHGLPVELVGLTEVGRGDPPEVEETGDTFLANALLKARAYAAWSGLAAVSVGLIDGTPCLDLPYEEDVRAETDMNVVMTGLGGLVEVQGTAEREPFSRGELDTLLDLAAAGIAELVKAQKLALGPMLEEAAIPPLRRLALGPASLDLSEGRAG